jgi:branched-chain amino acid transport system substrate-binding protein
MMKTLSSILAAAALSLSVTAAAAQDSEVIPVLVSIPITGPVASFGEHSRWGFELAFAQTNEDGGINGRKIEADYEDNRCNPAEAVKSVTQALDSKDYLAVLDGLCSSATLAIMPIIEREEVPMITANSSATAIAEQSGVGGNDWMFKVNPADGGLTEAIVAWLEKEGKAEKIALLAEDTDFGRAGAEGFTAALEKRGLELVAVEYYQQGTADFTGVLTKLKAIDANSIALYSIAADFQNLIRQYVSTGMKTPLTGRLLLNDVPEEIMKSGVLDGTTTVQPYTIEIETPENTEFVAAFEAMHGVKPNLLSFESYETGLVLADALRRAESIDRSALRDAIETTKFRSILGTEIEFDDNHLAHNNAVILRVNNGKVEVLGFSGT